MSAGSVRVPETSAAATVVVCAGALGAWQLGVVPPQVAVATGLVAGLGLGAVLVLATTRPGLQWYGPATTRGSGQRSQVALTFDDGPDPESTRALLAALDQAQARATFFLLGERVEQHLDLAREIVAAGHEVGLHGWSHDAGLVFWSPRRSARELQSWKGRLHELLGVEVRWFRPPFGITSPRLAESVQEAGLELAWCSVRTLDGVLRGQERLLRVADKARPGDVVLLHEGRGRPAARVLPGMLERLTARGLSAVTLGEVVA